MKIKPLLRQDCIICEVRKITSKNQFPYCNFCASMFRSDKGYRKKMGEELKWVSMEIYRKQCEASEKRNARK